MKQWKIQWGHKSFKIKAQIDRVVKLIDAFKNVGNVAVNADPLHAGLPWSVILGVSPCVSGLFRDIWHCLKHVFLVNCELDNVQDDR